MVQVRYAFFCEDIRIEQGGKITAVGLWGSKCLVPSFPFALRSIGFHAYIDNPDQTPTTFTLAVDGPFQPKPAEPLDDSLPVESGKSGTNLNFVFGPVQLTSEGDVTVRLRLAPQEQAPIEMTLTLGVALVKNASPS